MNRFKIGTEVYWTVGRGKNKRRIEGKITEFNPEIAPGTKYKITKSDGSTNYPIVNVHKVKRLAEA